MLALKIEDGNVTKLTEGDVNSLDWLQAQVGGYIEVVLRDDGILVLGNEEAKLRGMRPTCIRHDGEMLAGPLVVVGSAGEDFRDLTEAEAERVGLYRMGLAAKLGNGLVVAESPVPLLSTRGNPMPPDPKLN